MLRADGMLRRRAAARTHVCGIIVRVSIYENGQAVEVSIVGKHRPCRESRRSRTTGATHAEHLHPSHGGHCGTCPKK